MSLREVFPYWAEVTESFAQAVRPLGDAHLAWLPPGQANNIAWLVRHVVSVHSRDVLAFAAGEAPVPVPPDGADGTTYAAALLAGAVRRAAFLAARDVSVLMESRPFGQGRRTVGDALWNAFIEEVHHRGQVWAWLRMQGLTPPRI